MRTTAIRGTAVAALLSATALALAGCVNAEQAAPPGAGDSVSYGPPPSTAAAQIDSAHNQADVTFLNQAVLLRQQAVAISYLAATGSSNATLQSLATDIANDEQPQVNTLLGWLTQWQQPAPSATDPTTVPGLLATGALQQLQAAKGSAFDTQWTQSVKANLTNAQQDATTVQAQGQNAQVKQVAQEWTPVLKGELAKLATIGTQG